MLLAGSLLLSSCISVRSSGTRSGGRSFETFFIGEQGTQYFIKPLRFRHGKEELKADFTFRYLDQIRDSVTVNVSLFQPGMLRQLDSLVLESGTRRSVLQNPVLLFTEKKGKGFHARFSARMPLQELHDLFQEPGSWRVTPGHSGKTDRFTPTRKSAKSLRKLKDNLFILF